MRIAIIAALANNRVIGKDNQMPWYLPEDLAHFKQITMDKPIVMGRKTFESIGRPLPGRRNIILSRSVQTDRGDVTWVQDFEQAKAMLSDVSELMVIGGAKLYQQVLPQADVMYLTRINLTTEGDTFFPQWDESDWQTEVLAEGNSSKGDKLPYCFTKLTRKPSLS